MSSDCSDATFRPHFECAIFAPIIRKLEVLGHSLPFLLHAVTLKSAANSVDSQQESQQIDNLDTSLLTLENLSSQLRISLETEQGVIARGKALLENLKAQEKELEDVVKRIQDAVASGLLVSPSHDSHAVDGTEDMNANIDEIAEMQTQKIQLPATPETKPSSKKKSTTTTLTTKSAKADITSKQPIAKRLVIPNVESVDKAEFNQIPSYLLGRLTLQKVTKYITELNTTIQQKYSILDPHHAKKLTATQKALIVQYKQQETPAMEGLFFITETDMKTQLGKSFNVSEVRAFFGVMRHLGKIREVRDKGVRKYVFARMEN